VLSVLNTSSLTIRKFKPWMPTFIPNTNLIFTASWISGAGVRGNCSDLVAGQFQVSSSRFQVPGRREGVFALCPLPFLLPTAFPFNKHHCNSKHEEAGPGINIQVAAMASQQHIQQQDHRYNGKEQAYDKLQIV
jgi:hypothetical protein